MKTYALQFAEKSEADEWQMTGGEADYCSQDGAQALKARIEAYWAARGQQVMVALHNVGFHPAIRAARYDVRSDMVNGRPCGGSEGQESDQRSDQGSDQRSEEGVADFDAEAADLDAADLEAADLAADLAWR